MYLYTVDTGILILNNTPHFMLNKDLIIDDE